MKWSIKTGSKTKNEKRRNPIHRTIIIFFFIHQGFSIKVLYCLLKYGMNLQKKKNTEGENYQTFKFLKKEHNFFFTVHLSNNLFRKTGTILNRGLQLLIIVYFHN